MAVVDHHVATESASGVVVDAARAVGHVAHDDALALGEALDDVDEGTSIHGETLWHLQRNPFRSILADLGDRLGDLEVVVGGEEVLDRCLKKWVDLLLLLQDGRSDDRRRRRGRGARRGGRGASDEALARELWRFARRVRYSSIGVPSRFSSHFKRLECGGSEQERVGELTKRQLAAIRLLVRLD